MAKSPSDAEFATWLTPAAALQRLPSDWDLRTKRDAIMTGIADCSLVALARTVSVQNRGEETKHYRMTAITQELWRDPWRCRDRAFWTTGDITFDDEPPIQLLYTVKLDDEPEDDSAKRILTFKDVRIEPGSFAREFAGRLPADEPEPEAPTGNAGPLSAEEFAGWLTPKAALAAVPNEIDDAERRAWITRRLLERQIVARAETMLVTDTNGREEGTRAIIRSHFWSWRELGDWFSSGDLEVTDAPEVNSAGKRLSLTAYSFDREKNEVTRFTVAKFFGVRLDPAGFPAKPAPPRPPDLEQSEAEPEPEPDHREKTRLPDPWLKRWYELFILAYPDGSIELARQSVAGMFPRHHVSRERVRELFPNRVPGRPRKNKDNP